MQKTIIILDSILEEINNLKQAKELLDSIIGYYGIYSRQFETIPKHDSERINDLVRNYLNFDDSE